MGVLLGAVGDAGAHASRRCAASTGRATTSPGRHLEAEGELARLKDGKFYVVGANALFQDDLPIHKEIADAAKKAGVASIRPQQMTEGWIAGMVIEAALKGAGWPATPRRSRRPWPTSRSTPRACAAARSSGPRTTTSAPGSTTASIAGTAARSRVVQGLDRLRREVSARYPSRSEGAATASLAGCDTRATRRQYRRAGGDLCADRCGYVLIYRVSRVLNLAHGELMMLGAYLLLTTASLFAGHPADGDRGRRAC